MSLEPGGWNEQTGDMVIANATRKKRSDSDAPDKVWNVLGRHLSVEGAFGSEQVTRADNVQLRAMLQLDEAGRTRGCPATRGVKFGYASHGLWQSRDGNRRCGRGRISCSKREREIQGYDQQAGEQ